MAHRACFAALLSAALLGAGLGCGGDRPATSPNPAGGDSGGMEVSHAFDVADKRKLVAFAENVWVGRVAERTGSVSLPTSSPDIEIAQTQLAVDVLENVKGNLRGTVRVSQYGGPVDVVVERDGKRTIERDFDLMEGDPMLKPGEVVLFATRYNPSRDWHTIVAQPFADRRIRSQTEREQLVREFRQARDAQQAP